MVFSHVVRRRDGLWGVPECGRRRRPGVGPSTQLTAAMCADRVKVASVEEMVIFQQVHIGVGVSWDGRDSVYQVPAMPQHEAKCSPDRGGRCQDVHVQDLPSVF